MRAIPRQSASGSRMCRRYNTALHDCQKGGVPPETETHQMDSDLQVTTSRIQAENGGSISKDLMTGRRRSSGGAIQKGLRRHRPLGTKSRTDKQRQRQDSTPLGSEAPPTKNRISTIYARFRINNDTKSFALICNSVYQQRSGTTKQAR